VVKQWIKRLLIVEGITTEFVELTDIALVKKRRSEQFFYQHLDKLK